LNCSSTKPITQSSTAETKIDVSDTRISNADDLAKQTIDRDVREIQEAQDPGIRRHTLIKTMPLSSIQDELLVLGLRVAQFGIDLHKHRENTRVRLDELENQARVGNEQIQRLTKQLAEMRKYIDEDHELVDGMFGETHNRLKAQESQVLATKKAKYQAASLAGSKTHKSASDAQTINSPSRENFMTESWYSSDFMSHLLPSGRELVEPFVPPRSVLELSTPAVIKKWREGLFLTPSVSSSSSFLPFHAARLESGAHGTQETLGKHREQSLTSSLSASSSGLPFQAARSASSDHTIRETAEEHRERHPLGCDDTNCLMCWWSRGW
jgi:uncharacterized coiled-coil protein SlyX